MLDGRRILLIIGGGIAAYKTLDLIRKLRAAGAGVTPVLTRAGAQFVTPLSVAALAGERLHQDLFDLTAEAEMGHIQLSRVADLVVVAPATAHLMARMAQGLADDLATTLLLATDTPVLIAPAMNVRMWQHPATRRNLARLAADGVAVAGPAEGAMACGEFGPGRMAEPDEIMAVVGTILGTAPRKGGAVPAPGPGRALAQGSGQAPAGQAQGPGPVPTLAGRHVLVTSGPTHEPIDPVRYIANRSSGAQGGAIAAALRDLGARVSFVTGPASVPAPAGVDVVAVETAAQMLDAVEARLPADAAVFAAAVADWRVETPQAGKIKKTGSGPPRLNLAENPDILARVAQMGDGRPALVVGFAAETEQVEAQARAKRKRKGCDWIVANDVSSASGIMGGAENAVILITADGAEPWPRMPKEAVAARLAARIAAHLAAGVVAPASAAGTEP